MIDALPQPHALIDTVSTLLLFFCIAGILVPLLHRLKVSSVLAYLLCGIVIGPFGIAQFAPSYPWVSAISISETSTVNMLGEFGIMALMFMIGLDLSFSRLKELRRYILGIGTTQIMLTAIVIYAIARFFDNSLQTSVLLGASLALSSTAIVMKLLEEKKLTSRPIGILCFSVLLMQDLAVIPILVLAASFTSNSDGSIFAAMASAIALGVFTVAAIYLIGRRLLTPLLRSVSLSSAPEWLAAFIVCLVLAFAVLTHMAGLSMALGAFIAGVLIAETDFRHEVEVVISPLKGLLLGIFFLSIGMMIDVAEVLSHPLLLSLSVLGIYLIKGLIMFGVCLGFRLPLRKSAEASVLLAQPGEFALMILGVALASQLMPAQDAQFFLLVTVLAMMMTPLLFKLAPIAGNFAHRFARPDNTQQSDVSFVPSANKHSVVIAGFGRVGQLVATVLGEQKIPSIAFDSNPERVRQLKSQGFNVVVGDARKKELWQHLVDEDIEAAIIAIDDYEATKPILRSLRAQFPLLPVIVRSHDPQQSHQLYDDGASHVVAETLESSLRIAQLVMKNLSAAPK